MANKTEGTLIVKFVVTVGNTTYTPGKYTLSGQEYEELSNAPYVREATKEEVQAEKDYIKKVTAVRKAKGMKMGKEEVEETKIEEDETDLTPADDTKIEVVSNYTVEELEALPEVSLRTLYAAEQAKNGKIVPANIGVKTIIANLTK